MAGVIPYTEIKGFLATQFLGAYRVIDYDEIDDALTQEENPFLALEEVAAVEDITGLGDPRNICVTETGAFLVHCFSPSPESSGATRTIADAVRDALRFRILNGVRITDPGAPDPGSLMNEGLWSVASLSITYQWDTHKARP